MHQRVVRFLCSSFNLEQLIRLAALLWGASLGHGKSQLDKVTVYQLVVGS